MVLHASVHKLLIHGEHIIKHYVFVPIGQLFEEAQEAINKNFKEYREYNTRYYLRIANNECLIYNLLFALDPYVSSIRPYYKYRKQEELFVEFVQLLMSENEIDHEN
jgi:hypothetical protein